MLSVKEIQKEYAKSYIDKTRIYFIEHYLSTMDGENGMQPLKLFPRQKEFLKSLSEHKETIAIKHRQAGITTITSAWASGQIVFAPKDTPETILCIGNKLDLSQQLVEKIRNFLEQIPRWFWGDEYFSFDPKSEKNKKSIFLKCSKSELELFNGCKVYARSSGPNAARGISSVSLLVFDEAAFIENGMSVYAAAVAATSARKNRKIVMISTPNGKDALYYNTYSQALTKENNYNPVEFKWYQDLRYNKFLKWYKKNGETGEYEWIEEELLDDTGTVPYDEERWRELVKKGWTPTSPWYISMSKAFNNDSIMIAQELDGSFMGSANNVIAPEYIEMQETMNVREPLQDMKDPLVEETWFWKPPIEGHRYICCCDPSRGTSEDRTAIEIIDIDGRDENGMPIVEQVMEYLGKKLGDDIGGMMVQYATMYNNAYCVLDATGGQADAAIITMMQLGYKNFYYEDNNQKSYMIQNASKSLSTTNLDRLPGFHFQGNRYPVLANFATMVRSNEFKIRSLRVIKELETWIFKGEAQRIDHMDGMHDDTLTCLAMGLFVMIYSFNKLDSTKQKDAAILKAYIFNENKPYNRYASDSVNMRPKNDYHMPFYGSENKKRFPTQVQGDYLWVFGKMY